MVRGTVNYQYWTNRLNALNAQQKTTFDDDFAEREFRKGRSHNFAVTLGGPVDIPKLVDGRNKMFFFANYSHVGRLDPRQELQARARSRPTRSTSTATSRTCCSCPTRRSTRSTIR